MKLRRKKIMITF